MPTFVAPSSGTTRKQIEPGMYPARCYQMIDLGTHTDEYLGEKTTKRKIWLAWEFPDEKTVFSEEKGEEPYSIGREYGYTMGEKSTLRKDLESWRGKKWSNEEAYAFDCGKLIGAACQINVVGYTKKSGEPGVKVGTISPLGKGQICSPPVNKVQALSLDKAEFDHGVFNDLPKFLREKIQASPEYKALTGETPEPVFAGYSGPNQPEDTSDLPF